MIKRPSKIYLAYGSTDLRAGIDGYARIVQDRFMLDPFSDSMYCFCNKGHNKLKILYWDGNGFWLLYKRLEKHTFKWPKIKDSLTNMVINEQQLAWLLEGLSIEQKRAFKKTETKYI